MNATEYNAMVGAVRTALPGVMSVAAAQKQLPSVTTTVFITLAFPAGDDRQGLQIAYRQSDIYIQGYRTAAGTVYAAHNQLAVAQGATDLGFEDDYPSIGWKDRDKTDITKTIDDLDGALWRASVGKIGAIDFGTLAVTLAEAVRFKDVQLAVNKGTPISSRMTKWDAQVLAGNAVLLSG